MFKSPLPILILICALAVFHMLDFGHWSNESAIRSDGYGYYGYIEGALVHGDPLNTLHGEIPGREGYRSWMHEGLPGKHLPKMTMGLAYAWVPGFYIADALAEIFDYKRNGWTTPYQLAVAFTAILFLLLGCWALWHVLYQRFSGWIASLTVFVVFYGTNLLHYSTSDSGMSHVYSFGLIALYLLLNDKWLNHYKTNSLLWMSLILGWIVLIRPTNITIGLVTPIMLYANTGSLKELIQPKLALAAFVAFLPILPQLVFWKFTTGDWVNYSYENEAFYWLTGNAVKGLFSYRNGWLLYTPIMILALKGLFFNKRLDKGLYWASITVIALHIYITFSWWCWYYGGSLSIRPMIDMYALCAFGLAGFITFTFKKSRWLGMAVTALIAVLVWNNYLQTNFFYKGAITDSTMTKKAYYAFFMNPKVPSDLSLIGDAYRDADTDRLRKGLPERTDFDTILIDSIASIKLDGDQEMIVLSKSSDFSPNLKVLAKEVITNKNQMIKVTFETYCDDYDAAKLLGVISFSKNDVTYDYRAADIIYTNPIDGQVNTSNLFFTKPREVPDDAELSTYLWFTGKGEANLKLIELKLIEVTYSEDQ
ncbi:hypothetical protein N9545_08650 [Salibacteraceae bacterium]|nr:hypothetical protein [Salibacteraceae bacterium]MDB4105581.1 hypothetical protein [Salibacteraceae bacterium]MDB9710373.1 hypothetical protein [Salibacteraceae bacterium]